MATAAEATDAIRDAVASEPTVAVAYLFGSVARGDAGPDSDLDVGLVFTDRDLAARERAEVCARVADALARRTGVSPVDVVDLEVQGPIFCHRVLLEGHAAHVGDEARRVDFVSDTLSRAFDFRPTYDLATKGKPTALRRWLRERYDL